MSPPKPKKQDVEAVAQEMERGETGKGYRTVAWEVAERVFPVNASYHDMDDFCRSLIDAAIRLLLRRRDRVIRAARKWRRGRVANFGCYADSLQLEQAVDDYDTQRRGRGRK